MILLKKTHLLLGLILFVLGGCTTEPKPPPPPVIVQSTLPLAFLPGTWEVSDAERNGKNTAALEGIYFTFTTDEKLITNFNVSIQEQTFPYRMQGDTLFALSDPQHLYFIESLAEKAMVIRTQMEGFPFKLILKTRDDGPTEEEEGI